jgi:hypothetical protein
MIISTYETCLDEADVMRTLRKNYKNLVVDRIDLVYYPYTAVVYQINMKNTKSRMHRKMMCVTDMINGRGAIGDKDPVLKEIEVEDIDVLPIQLTDEEFKTKSHDYMIRTVLMKIRVMYLPDITIDHQFLFHKMYYIVRCINEEQEPFVLMVDSMDGSIANLDVA